MKKYFALSLALMASTLLFGENKQEPVVAKDLSTPIDLDRDIDKISKALGHLLGQNLTSMELQFNIKEVIAGIEGALEGQESPMSEEECIHAITLIQERAYQMQSNTNLAKAEEFLAKNKAVKNVVELVPGKLQYIQLQEGKGEVVKENYSPSIRFKGTFIDGKVFAESKEEEIISLSDSIAGLRQAMVGMKEGEKRTIFIHPELGYGQAGGYLPPNSLLTFEIEVVKATTTPKEEQEALSLKGKGGDRTEELASIDAPQELVR